MSDSMVRNPETNIPGDVAVARDAARPGSTRRLKLSPAGGIALALIAVVVLAQPLLSGYYQTLLIQAFLFAILAVSVDMLWGYAGILSFGQGAFFGIGGYAIAITFVHVTSGGLAWPIAAALGLGVAVVVAALVGWFTFYARAKLNVMYIAVITLAAAVIFEQLMLSGGNLTGSSSGLAGFQAANLSDSQWYWLSAGALLAVTVATWVLVRSDAGRVLVAIRDNEERCRYLGLNVPAVKTGLFTLAGAVAATAGLLYVAYTSSIAPSLAGFVLATNAVIWAAVGGRGTLVGPILGAVIVNVFGASLNERYPFYWLLFLGALFVIVVVAIPEGVVPSTWSLLRRGKAIARRPLGSSRGVASDGKAQDRTGVSIVEHPGGGARASRKAGQSALELKGVRKAFGSFEAVGGVSFAVEPGELVSVVGPNGAGKTSLIRCIADGRERSDGEVTICGKSAGELPPHRLVAMGVGRKFQAANVFDSLTVAESLQLAGWRGALPSMWRKSNTVDAPSAALHVMQTTGLQHLLDEKVRNLGHGQKQALELAMVLCLEPTVLLLDEPTAGLTREERFAIADVLTHLVEQRDMCILLIEHDFQFVKQISTRMIVLHEGKLLLDGTVQEVSESDVVKSVYLGHSVN